LRRPTPPDLNRTLFDLVVVGAGPAGAAAALEARRLRPDAAVLLVRRTLQQEGREAQRIDVRNPSAPTVKATPANNNR